MNNYRMLISYDGSNFQGWQRLGKNERTVQGVLETELTKRIGEPIELIGSGRTDAGVHAVGQVANFKTKIEISSSFLEQLNKTLPIDIAIIKIDLVAEKFHSRYHATEKEYLYVVDTNERPSVFRRKYVYHYPQQLNIEEMRKAAEYLQGEHDFTSFTDEKTERMKIRTLKEIRIVEDRGRVEFIYRGDGFLMHMVRILTGTLLEVGTGKRKASDIIRILEKKTRSEAGAMVPAKGLFLKTVYYS